MSSPMIKVNNLSKLYRICAAERGYKTFREAIIEGITAPVRNFARLRSLTKFKDAYEKDVIWALKDISFEVNEGEVLGIIGNNGAGKTTILKILSHITEPTSGFAEIHGRVSSLLEVGTGFHPELTGQENIFLNGAILGMRKREIERKFDEIVNFAEVEKFIDTPIKRYSTGMQVRLAFAVAAHLEPEVLLIDEVLAVGDIAFQKKCLGKMEDVAKGGRTVIFVSHNMQAVGKLCSKGILLDNGKITYMGDISETINHYTKHTLPSEEAELSFPPDPEKKVQIQRLKLLNHQGEPTIQLDRDFPFQLVTEYQIREEIVGAHIGLTIDRVDGLRVCFSRDIDENPDDMTARKVGYYRSVVEFPGSLLNTGTYQITIGIGEHGKKPYDYHEAFVFDLIEHGAFTWLEGTGTGKRPGIIALPLKWKTEEIL